MSLPLSVVVRDKLIMSVNDSNKINVVTPPPSYPPTHCPKPDPNPNNTTTPDSFESISSSRSFIVCAGGHRFALKESSDKEELFSVIEFAERLKEQMAEIQG